MLVPSAVGRTPCRCGLIDQDRFQALLERTTGFLYKLSTISPTCQRDRHTLENIQRVLFGGLVEQK